MTNRKIKKKFIDRDSIKSDYCCSFVRGDDTSVDNIVQKTKELRDLNLKGTEIKEFYESIVHTPPNIHESCSSKRGEAQRSGTKRSRKSCKTVPQSLSRCPRLKPIKREHLRKDENDGNDENNEFSTYTYKGKRLSVDGKDVKEDECDDVMIVETVSRSYRSNKMLTGKLLKLSSQGNTKELKSFTHDLIGRNDYVKILNSTDQYGWTAVMCAAAEGHLKIVKHLISQGCLYRNVTDNVGRDVFDICKEKKKSDVLHYLEEYEKFNTEQYSVGGSTTVGRRDSEEITKCELCGVEYPRSKRNAHESSMIHIFSDGSKVVGRSYEIPDHNKGFQMMVRSGWDLNQGLGPEGSGRKNPVKTILKRDRHGLGVKSKAKSRINHFSAFDRSAVERAPEKRVAKQTSIRTYEEKLIKEKAWEKNMRHYMSSDF